MTRRSLSKLQRVRVFDAADGICHFCEVKIHAERGEQWDVSHVIALESGGADEPSNMKPAHRSCHRKHTAEVDVPLIAKIHRQRQKHLGISRSSRPMDGSRGTKWKRKINGEVVLRS